MALAAINTIVVEIAPDRYFRARCADAFDQGVGWRPSPIRFMRRAYWRRT
jgi:hypothetical protein